MLTAHSPPKSDYITVLAIYDDPSVKLGEEQTKSTSNKLSISVNGSLTPKGNGKDLTLESNDGKREKETDFRGHRSSDGLFSANLQQKSPSILRNSKRNNEYDGNTVHFRDGDKVAKIERWNKGNARKSRMADSFLEAKESIERELNGKWLSFDRNVYKFQRIVLSSDTQDTHLGLEVSAVPDPMNSAKLLAIEVRSIEENGRIAEDGRLRIGDQIVEINELPCERISFARTRLRLRELQSVPNPSLGFFRRFSPAKSQNRLNRIVPVTTMLQKGNTSQIGKTETVRLIKGKDGFGFSYVGRESFGNERKENLYYVKGLRGSGELNGIAVGDRILQIDQMPLAEMTQSQVTALLKGKLIGECIELLISRNFSSDHFHEEETDLKMERGQINPSDQLRDELKTQFGGRIDVELLCLDILLNDTPGAGLGLSLKAQRVGAIDSGLYIRSILHGSAAFKDGRLQVNDRLVGIEDQNLLNYELNGAALDAFIRTISQMHQTKKSIKLFVTRKMHSERSMNPTLASNARRGSDSDISQLSTFDRDATTRRSISEKRSTSTHRDPSHIRTYQKIIHQRQISAPALSSLVSNAKRSRRSFHDEIRTANAFGEKNQRPKTVFYVDETDNLPKNDSLDELNAFSATFPRSDTLKTSKHGKKGGSADCEKDAMPSSTSFPFHLCSSSMRNDTKSSSQRHDEVEFKHTKQWRSSLGNGILKFFGGRTTIQHNNNNEPKEANPNVNNNRMQMRSSDFRAPPPPYRLPLNPVFHPTNPCCSSDPFYQCSFTANSSPTGNYNRTNPCTQFRHHNSVRGQPPLQDHFSAASLINRPSQFHSPHFGHGEVHQSLQDDENQQQMCRQQQQPMHVPYQQLHSHRKQENNQPQAWTTMTLTGISCGFQEEGAYCGFLDCCILSSISGSGAGWLLATYGSTLFSRPDPALHEYSDVSDDRFPWHSLYRPAEEEKKAKPKPSAIFYDYGSDWVIRC